MMYLYLMKFKTISANTKVAENHVFTLINYDTDIKVGTTYQIENEQDAKGIIVDGTFSLMFNLIEEYLQDHDLTVDGEKVTPNDIVPFDFTNGHSIEAEVIDYQYKAGNLKIVVSGEAMLLSGKKHVEIDVSADVNFTVLPDSAEMSVNQPKQSNTVVKVEMRKNR
ncbi:hypothetical protein HAU32_11265 [Weissella confusa]|uniref:Uncharacterized protein n=1 Tax=Weissella fermenti TaxID=2987699 RepID=A0ABT6D645_9LACO|nr:MULTISPECIES: hypothetical protein [Weissella]MBJ7689515.1 hypothetical protein [Weissella confusa]MDF9301003.1 hypothetical protein [Weissella sp. BK2]